MDINMNMRKAKRCACKLYRKNKNNLLTVFGGFLAGMTAVLICKKL